MRILLVFLAVIALSEANEGRELYCQNLDQKYDNVLPPVLYSQERQVLCPFPYSFCFLTIVRHGQHMTVRQGCGKIQEDMDFVCRPESRDHFTCMCYTNDCNSPHRFMEGNVERTEALTYQLWRLGVKYDEYTRLFSLHERPIETTTISTVPPPTTLTTTVTTTAAENLTTTSPGGTGVPANAAGRSEAEIAQANICDDNIKAVATWSALGFGIVAMLNIWVVVVILYTMQAINRIPHHTEKLVSSVNWLNRTSARCALGPSTKQELGDYAKGLPELAGLSWTGLKNTTTERRTTESTERKNESTERQTESKR